MTRTTFLRRVVATLLLSLSASAGADAFEDILERGTIRIGVAEFAPWTIRKDNGTLVGFEIDVANKLASDMGVRADFSVYAWDAIIPALQAGDIDVIAGGMAITPARALKVNFSRPLAQSGVGLATNTRMTRNIETLDQLDDPDVVISTVADTLAHSLAKTLFPNASLNAFTSSAEAEKSVLEGQAHAYVASMPEARFLSLRHADVVDLPVSEPLIATSEALAVAKGQQELLNFLDAWVTARRSDKWLATTRDYWFGTLDWAESERE